MSLYKRVPVRKLKGSEHFKNTDRGSFSVLDFWQYGFSGLNANVLRGVLAEFLVEKALKGDQEIGVRNPWGDYDIDYKGRRIEVKCSSYLQDWDQEDFTKIKWSGLKATELYWSTAVNGEYKKGKKTYKADIYILALVHHKEPETLDLLDLKQWSFYVLSRERLKEISEDRSVATLSTVENAEIDCVPFSELSRLIKNYE